MSARTALFELESDFIRSDLARMFEARLIQGQLLKKLVDAVKELCTEVITSERLATCLAW